ncbi:transposase [Gluconacetobacter sacchari DSM 12717]|uniref:Transposase n=1 Tax=Gluconacetobacter sacchari DSM 12717 TaxID=1307940 RepID=A0ABQ0P4R2_9PROT|nr:transposase [Gluconacetobacter sacchari DSM 12717]
MDSKTDEQTGRMDQGAGAPRAQEAGRTGKRFSAKRKLGAVQRLLRGESLDTVSRDLQVPAHRLSEWRDHVLARAEDVLTDRERDGRDEVCRAVTNPATVAPA